MISLINISSEAWSVLEFTGSYNEIRLIILWERTSAST